MGSATTDTKAAQQAAALHWLGSQIRVAQLNTWHWQHVMGVSLSPTTGDSLNQLGVRGAKLALHRWQRLAKTTLRTAQHPPHFSQFMCIHHFEGSWNDTGAPYWGGLQMNYGFQATYGRWLLRTKGTADHWSPLEQIWVAEKAAESRGFYPWPNTARYCGLI